MRETGNVAPQWFTTDPRFMGVSLAAQGLVFRLVLAGSSIEMLPNEDPEATLAAMLGNVRGSAEAAREVVMSGILRTHALPDGHKCIALSRPVAPPAEALPPPATPPTPPPTQPPDDGPSWAPSAPREASTAASQGKPSDSPAARRLRSDRHLFMQRAQHWANVPREVTWGEWVSTPVGKEWVAVRDEEYPGYADRVRGGAVQGRVVTPPPAQGNAPANTPGGCYVTPTPALPNTHPNTPGNTPIARASSDGFSDGNTQKEGEGEASACEGGNTPANTPHGRYVTPPLTPPPALPNTPPSTTTTPSVESAPTTTTTAPRSTTPILDAIAKTAPRISVRSVPLIAREATERTLATYPNATPMEVLRAMQHATHGSWISKREHPLPIARLLENGCSNLGELLDDARLCAQCNPKGAKSLAPSPRSAGQGNASKVPTPATINGETAAQILRKRHEKAVAELKAKRAAEEAKGAQLQPGQEP